MRHWIDICETAHTMSFAWDDVSPRGLLDSETIVWLDVAKVDASYGQDKRFYVSGPESPNAIEGRYERFGEWLKRGIAVKPPEIHLTPWDRIGFTNGRHRFAWMKNHGETRMPFIVPKDEAEEIVQRFS